MDSIVVFTIGFAALVVFIASLWYLFQTVRVMWGYSSLLAIAALLLSPLVHIIFYFVPKDGFDKYEKGLFKKYFLSIGALFALGVIATAVIPAIKPQYQAGTMANNVDISQPWDWDIRAESLEETTAQNEIDSTDTADAEAVHYDAIYQAHPDADKILDSPEYALWLQGHTAEEQNSIAGIMKEGTASEVVYVFDNFKEDLTAYRENEYHTRRENAQALAQTQYQERRVRELETIKSNNQRDYDRQRKQEIAEYVVANRAPPLPTTQQAPAKRSLSYSERQEREKLKDLIRQPIEGSKGLTTSQRDQLVALELDQPMPSRSQRNSGSTSTPTPTPNNMASCDGAGCWDTNGTRYNKGAGETYFPSTGGVCQNVGGQIQCN